MTKLTDTVASISQRSTTAPLDTGRIEGLRYSRGEWFKLFDMAPTMKKNTAGSYVFVLTIDDRRDLWSEYVTLLVPYGLKHSHQHGGTNGQGTSVIAHSHSGHALHHNIAFEFLRFYFW